jgi:putative ABC transport system permease protein
MTTLAHESALGGPANGGVAARRAVVRWSARMFRREWRQQLLVLALLTCAVAAAIGSVTIAANAVPADNSEFGSASQILTFDGSDRERLAAGLDAARQSFGAVDLVGHRSVQVPGGVETVDYRSLTPGGAYTGELLSLRRGTYPNGLNDVAVTDDIAQALRLQLGSPLTLDGHRRTVVGIVENPRKLSDEFALVSPSSATPDYVDVFVGASTESTSSDSFFRALDGRNPWRRAFTGSRGYGSDVSDAAETFAIFSVAAVFLLLASLVAAAGFAVVAQRRLRQLGMLAAVGATQKHVRLVLTTNGAVVGTIAAVIGTIAGLALWIVFAPTLESAVDHRIDRLRLPWGLIALAVALAVLGATAAAWWPGRTVARLPVMATLSGRPPRPRPARHSALAAGVLMAVGIGSLALSDRDTPLLIVVGILATIVGTLLLGPPAIRIFARTAGPAPVAVRLALRDLTRYQARSGAALAAITLALGIAAAVVVVAAAEEQREADRIAASLPNLTDRQIRVYTGATRDPNLIPLPLQAPAQLAASAAHVRQLAGALDDAAVIPLVNAYQPGESPMVTFEGDRALVTVGLARQASPRHWTRGSGLYVATPALLRYLGVDPGTIDSSTDFLADPSVPTDRLVILSPRARRQSKVTNVHRIDSRAVFGSGGEETGRVPDSFVTLDGLRRHGWKQVAGGWLIESNRPLTNVQIADAREVAAESGLTIETRREPASLAMPRTIATVAGAVLALVVLAMTVGLIRSEGAGDLRTLTATGATSRIRRTLTATTAGALALLGALLGVAGAYVVLAATYHDDLGYLSDVPVLYLTLAVVGVPLAATAAGWLLAGREPPAVARTVIE